MFGHRAPRRLSDDEQAILDRIVPQRSRMGADALARHDKAVVDLLDRCRWEAAAGFELTDHMRVVIAGRAAVLAIGFTTTPLSSVRTIVVHPATIQLSGPRPGPMPGTVVEGPNPVLGHTAKHGPVFIAWDAVQRDMDRPARGRDVVLHEFAHQLDFADGIGDGTPQLRAQLRQRWIEVCQAELDALRAGEGSALLRGYAARNPSEFFAVATEVFFTRGAPLADDRPALYGVLRAFYGQDPAAAVTGPP